MEKQQKTTGQQDTNAALAALAAAGNSFALGQLWEINKGLLHRWFWQWYDRNKAVADEHGITLEDFDQEGFFAVQAAAKAYDPEKGSFATLLGYYVQSQINKAVCGEHSRLVTTEDGKQVRLSANPLNACTSLDVPVGEDGSGTVLADLQEDPAAAHEFQQAEQRGTSRRAGRSLEQAGRPGSRHNTPPLLQRPESEGYRAGYRHIQQPREPNRTARLSMSAQRYRPCPLAR